MNSPSVSGDKKSNLVDAVDVASTSAEAKLKPRSRWVQCTLTHTHIHSNCIHYAYLQIAHTPRITQDQAANQQRVGRLQFAVIMAP